jgi:hypothetical protein
MAGKAKKDTSEIAALRDFDAAYVADWVKMRKPPMTIRHDDETKPEENKPG